MPLHRNLCNKSIVTFEDGEFQAVLSGSQRFAWGLAGLLSSLTGPKAHSRSLYDRQDDKIQRFRTSIRVLC